MNPLAKLSGATTALAESTTLDEIKAIRDMAEQARLYAQANKLGLDAINAGTEIRLRADRRMGEVLILAKETGEIKVGNPQWFPEGTIVLQNVGISKKQSHVTQQLAKIPEEEFQKRIEEAKAAGERLTTGKVVTPHVAHNSGENEWYTPKEYIEAAREVMGGIDVDPASSAKANEIVKAEKHYTIRDNGLLHEWYGRVWLNPPYAQPLVGQFATHLVRQVRRNNVSQAIVLVNNATETQWFREMVDTARAVAFPTGRVRFWSPSGVNGAPLQGQAILYFGENHNGFLSIFRAFGWVALL